MVILTQRSLWKKHIALPQEHGSWVFLLSPLLIGLFAGGRFTPASGYLVLGTLAAFMFKQPSTMAIKIFSGRRGKRDLPGVYFWMGVYGLVGIVGFIGLWLTGQASLFILGLPGLPVFIWYLYLVSRRAERRQFGVEIIASGALALSAPAAYWIGVGETNSLGWWLWILTWFQSAASIMYAALRLEQRELGRPSFSFGEKLHLGRRALLYTNFNLGMAITLRALGIVSGWVAIPFLIQWGETVLGVLKPAVGMRPTQIGVRQLIVSTVFTIAFILTWG